MQKKVKFTSIFLVLLVLSSLIFVISKAPFLKGAGSVLMIPFSPIRAEAYNVYIGIISLGGNETIENLKQENQDLRKKIVQQQKLQQDNNALRDQFQSTKVSPVNLIPAAVIGAPSFIPGVSLPDFLIIDKGTGDGIKYGNAVVFKDNLIGKITKVSSNISTVSLISSSSTSFTGKTGESGKIIGVIKGQGGEDMILDNILLSENLKKGDLVLTKGDVDSKGEGFPPNLVVGKIISIDKNPSALFQKADVVSFADFSKLTTVFVIK